jgi:hypothetical protein
MMITYAFADLPTLSALVGRDQKSLARWVLNASNADDFPVRTNRVRRTAYYSVRDFTKWYDQWTRERHLPPAHPLEAA